MPLPFVSVQAHDAYNAVQLRVLMECLQAEELSEAAAYSQLIPALMAIADRFEELYASASSSTDLVQLLR